MSGQLEAQPQYDEGPEGRWRDSKPVPGVRRALYILAFIVMVLAMDRLVGFVLGQVVMRSQHRYSMLYSGRIDADVVVVGNSRGVHSLYAPEIEERLGVKAFNLSMNGLGMDTAAVLVGDYLDRNRVPQVILVEVTALQTTPGESIGAVHQFQGTSARAREIYRRFAPRKYWAARLSSTYQYNGQSLEKFLLYLRRDDQHWISSADRTVAPDLLANRELPAPIPVDPYEIESWRNVVRAAEAKGVRVVPFVAPYLQGSLGSRDLGKEYAEALGSAGTGLKVWDYSRAVQPDEAFSDRVHTNVVGARLLFEAMVKDGVFEGLK